MCVANISSTSVIVSDTTAASHICSKTQSLMLIYKHTNLNANLGLYIHKLKV
jgi:hypothetical protein